MPDMTTLPMLNDPVTRSALDAQTKISEVYRQRCMAAFARFAESARNANGTLAQAHGQVRDPIGALRDASAYWVDFAQRTVLFWDTIRERGNDWLDHERAGKPPLLDFEWEMVADARSFPRPANYALVKVRAPKGCLVDDSKRAFVVIDPRAGHGPGIGGFKQDSQVGVALKAGHPVYVVIFFPEPVEGQTLADVSAAEAEFLRVVRARHPETPKPVVIGNCQGGWAAMLMGALDPDLPGPIVINGAPMSYWAGNDGENPMRYAGGMLGGVWPALFASDLGGGLFDGAHLVDNFEYLNPANTYFDKLYNLFSKIDTEPARYREFERWWGGFFMMGRPEIEWIVENLFVGNKLSSGEAEWSEGRAFDLRSIRSPIIVFASLGDNITPPQQAFNWVADLYPTTASLKAHGQVIVGLMHQSVGHLGIFVSGQVARREHTQIVDLVGYIEHLPPGLYGMQIEQIDGPDGPRFDVVLTERRVEDLAGLQAYGRRDEVPFQAVQEVSKTLATLYETFVHPALAPMVSPAAARVARMFHPQRVRRWALSDLNPMLWPVRAMAQLAQASRASRDDHGPSVAMERWSAAMVSAAFDLHRDLRDATVETAFFRTYTLPALLTPAQDEKATETSDTIVAATAERALSHMAEGDRTKAIVRIALLLLRAGTGRRRLSAMKRARELVGQEIGLIDMPTDAAREIIAEQSYIVELAPEEAIDTLPRLVPKSEDRKATLDLLERLKGKFETNAEQRVLAGRLRDLLSASEPIAVRTPRVEALVERAPVPHPRSPHSPRRSS